MSEAPNGGPPQGAPIRTPGQLIAAVIAGFAVPTAIISLLAVYVDNTTRTGAGTDELSSNEVSHRIAPIAQVTIRDVNAPRVYKTGQQVFKAVCSACHATGVSGAPKFGNASDWAPRIAQGYDTLWHTALSGKGAMPPRGGTSPEDYSDYEIGLAVAYMANHGGAQFKAPRKPAANAPQAAAASAAQAAQAATQVAIAQARAAIAAVGKTPPAPAPSAGGAPQSADASQAGKALFQQVCQQCHMAGVMGAPKFGNKADWAPRLKDPMDTIYNYALHGKGQMPPKGGSNASDADVKAAVDYMVNAAK